MLAFCWAKANFSFKIMIFFLLSKSSLQPNRAFIFIISVLIYCIGILQRPHKESTIDPEKLASARRRLQENYKEVQNGLNISFKVSLFIMPYLHSWNNVKREKSLVLRLSQFNSSTFLFKKSLVKRYIELVFSKVLKLN